jgi:hypothetical protein
LELLKSVGGAAGVMTGVAFIDGWLYWATYYAAFGLNPLVLDFPTTVVSVSPLWVLARDLGTEQGVARAVIILVLMLCVGLGALFAHLYAHRQPFAVLSLICLAVLMSVGAVELGTNDARRDAGCQSRLQNISFELNAQPDPTDPPRDCIKNDYCKLIIHAGNGYHYLVAPDCTLGALPPGQVATGVIFESEIKTIRTNRFGW